MEIGKVSQPIEQISVNTQPASGQKVSEKAEVPDNRALSQKDFQVNVQDGLKGKLAEFSKNLQNQQQLIQSLPEDVQKAVVELLQQMASDAELPQGLEVLLKGQKNIADQLKNMANILIFATALQSEEHSDVRQFLQKVLENITGQSELSPETAARELLQLAKQLSANTTTAQGNTKLGLQEVLQQNLPEDIGQLSSQEQKIVNQLTKVFGKDMPLGLQQLAQQNKLPELPGVWATLKAAEAWQFKNIQPKTLQAAAELLEELAKEMSPTLTMKGTVASHLEQFVKNLPSDISNKAAVVAQMEQFIKNLPAEPDKKAATLQQLEQFIKKFSSEMGNKSTMLTQLGQFIKSLPLDTNSKASLALEVEQLIKNLPPETDNKAAVLQKLEQFAKSLPVEGGNKAAILSQLESFVKGLPPETGNKAAIVNQLEQFTKTLPAEGGNKAAILSQLEQFIKSLPSEAGNKAAVVNQLEKFIKNLPPQTSNQATVINELEKFVANLPSEIGNKAAVTKQLEQFIKTLPPENVDKTTMLTQLEQLVKSLPPEISSKAGVVTQMEQFLKTLPPEVSNKVAVATQLEQFIKTLPTEIGKALQQALRQGNIPENLQRLADVFNNAAVLNKHTTIELQSFLGKVAENLTAKSPTLPAESNNVIANLAKQFVDTTATVTQIKTVINQLKMELFANDPVLLEKEKLVLEKLTKLFEQNIPPALQEGVIKHKLAELPKFWVLLKALGTEQWQNAAPENLEKSAGVVKELAHSMYKATALTGEKQAETYIVSFSLPLQVAQGIYYPAHIHIYHENKNNNNNDDQEHERQFETWIRVCVETEHIGVVDSVFRLYGDDNLDVRVTFPNATAAEEFAQQLPEIRKNMEEGKLNLTDIMINKV